jgi:tetratricopeptide (TPR) repeat protein
MDDGTPIKSILARVVDALHEQKPDIHVVVTPMMAYGQALEYDAKWVLAADVYRTVLAHLHPAADADASVSAHLRLGQCYHHLQRLDEATAVFGTACEIATAAGDIVSVLRARIGEARIATLRGNLPRAEHMLDEAIREATTPQLRDVRSLALHNRSGVATLRGDYELAIRLGYEALEHSQSSIHRDGILSDIAGAFFYLGVYSAARDAYLVLAATGQAQYTRWVAGLNLLEIAAHTGVETLFESYRRQLADDSLPPMLATAFQLNLGTGYKKLGHMDKARMHLENAIALAEEHRLSQYLFEAEESLKALETPAPLLRPNDMVSLGVEEVAQAIRGLREKAGVL